MARTETAVACYECGRVKLNKRQFEFCACGYHYDDVSDDFLRWDAGKDVPHIINRSKILLDGEEVDAVTAYDMIEGRITKLCDKGGDGHHPEAKCPASESGDWETVCEVEKTGEVVLVVFHTDILYEGDNGGKN